MTPKYTDRKLSKVDNEIRLLRFDKKRRLTISVFAFEQAPPYTTLSYGWREKTDHLVPSPQTISIRHAKGVDKVIVEANLWLFLQRAIQKLSKTTWLWIDRLCIDQDDPAERTHQVGIMAQIYSRAEDVIVWLGEMSEAETAAVKCLMPGKILSTEQTRRLFPPFDFANSRPSSDEAAFREWALRERAEQKAAWLGWLEEEGAFPRWKTEETESFNCCGCYVRSRSRDGVIVKIRDTQVHHCSDIIEDYDSISRRIDQALSTLCGRVYWSRLWTVQEFLKSKHVSTWIGDLVLDLFDLIKAVYLLNNPRLPTMTWLDSHEDDKRARGNAEKFSGLVDLCKHRFGDKDYISQGFHIELTTLMQGRYCREPHDYVYALLSLCDSGIIADYTKPLSRLFWEVNDQISSLDGEGDGSLEVARKVYKVFGFGPQKPLRVYVGENLRSVSRACDPVLRLFTPIDAHTSGTALKLYELGDNILITKCNFIPQGVAQNFLIGRLADHVTHVYDLGATRLTRTKSSSKVAIALVKHRSNIPEEQSLQEWSHSLTTDDHYNLSRLLDECDTASDIDNSKAVEDHVKQLYSPKPPSGGLYLPWSYHLYALNLACNIAGLLGFRH